jgi:hypothetical protein
MFARCGGDRLGAVRYGADHAWRERPLRRQANPNVVAPTSLAGSPPFSPPRRGGLGWVADGAANFVHDPGDALNGDLWVLWFNELGYQTRINPIPRTQTNARAGDRGPSISSASLTSS